MACRLACRRALCGDLEDPEDPEDLEARCHSHVEAQAQCLARCPAVAPATVPDSDPSTSDLEWVSDLDREDRLAWDLEAQEDRCRPS